MSLQRGFDGAEPVRADGSGTQEIRKARRSAVVATGTLACPACDAPVSPGRGLTPSEPLACPFCAHGGAVRDFLTLGSPSRPARVQVRVIPRVRF